MRMWKQVSAYCLAATLMVSGAAGTAWAASPEFSRTAQEWEMLRDNKMEFSELAGLVREYNVTVQNNQKDYNENRNKSSDDMAQNYRDMAAAVRNGITGEDSAFAMAADAQAENTAQNLEEQADNNVNDSEILKMGYDQTEATLVSAAQTNMIAYHQSLLDLELKQKNREVMSAVYDGTVAKQSTGMATNMDVLTAWENLLKADAEILLEQSNLSNIKQKLCVMLGWKYDASPEIGDIPTVDINRITALNPETDKAKALENNYTLRMNKRKLANSSGNTSAEKLKLIITDNEQKIGTSISIAYRGVLEAKNAYDQASTAYAAETRNMEAAKLKLQIGSISKVDYLKQEAAYLQKQIGLKTADMNLFQSVESYGWAVNGLAGT